MPSITTTQPPVITSVDIGHAVSQALRVHRQFHIAGCECETEQAALDAAYGLAAIIRKRTGQ